MLIEGFYGKSTFLVITEYDYVIFYHGRITVRTKGGKELCSNYMERPEEALPMLKKLNEVQQNGVI